MGLIYYPPLRLIDKVHVCISPSKAADCIMSGVLAVELHPLVHYALRTFNPHLLHLLIY